MLTSKERAEFRAQANGIDTTLMVGKDGVTENVAQQAALELKAKELIKLKVLETAFLTAREASEILCEMLEAEPVQCIGSKLVLYKPNPEKPGIVLPKEK